MLPPLVSKCIINDQAIIFFTVCKGRFSVRSLYCLLNLFLLLCAAADILFEKMSLCLVCGTLGSLAVLGAYGRSIVSVAAGRRRLGVAPPRTDGPEEFVRLLRAQQNTLEFVVAVLPLLWMSAVLLPVVGPLASLVGASGWAFWRVKYIDGYAKSPEERLPGFYGSMTFLKMLGVTVAVGLLYQVADLLE